MTINPAIINLNIILVFDSLHRSCKHNHPEAIMCFASNSADPTIKPGHCGLTPYTVLSKHNPEAIMFYLLIVLILISRDTTGCTFVHHAVQHNHPEAMYVFYLLIVLDPNIKDNNGCTPVHQCCTIQKGNCFS